MHHHCARSRFSKCQPFECSSIASGHAFQKCPPFDWTSIAPGHAFQNASALNAPLLRQGHAFQNDSHLKLNASLLHQVILFKMPAI
jgi:hypothetical protein